MATSIVDFGPHFEHWLSYLDVCYWGSLPTCILWSCGIVRLHWRKSTANCSEHCIRAIMVVMENRCIFGRS
ncbi:hypothetical protein BDW72DRAFT_38818 [Aspergillus terricola var. indicus]